MNQGSNETCEVLVVGAGPVGLFTALALSDRGVRVRIVDKYRRAALHSYALGLHPRTLRLFDRFDLTNTLAPRGLPLRGADVWIHGERRVTIDYAAIGGAHPYVLVLSQSVLEAALERRLAANGVEVEWGRSMLAFEDRGDEVGVVLAETVEEPDGGDVSLAPSRLSVPFVVGADGYDSVTRRLLSVPRDEVGMPLTYGLVEFDSRAALPDRATLLFGQQWSDVCWPLARDRARWSVQLSDDSATEDGSVLLTVIRQRAPWFDTDGCRVDWVTCVGFRPYLARRFGRGGVWLAGDSGHLSSPVGVQSMNVGLREGYDLARRLADVLRKGRSTDLLRFYHEERMREWKMLLGVHDRLQTLPGAPGWAVELGARLVRSLPATGRNLNALLRQVGLRLDWVRGKRPAQGV